MSTKQRFLRSTAQCGTGDIFLMRPYLHHPDIHGHLLRRYFNAVISTSKRHGTAISGEAERLNDKDHQQCFLGVLGGGFHGRLNKD